MLILSADVKSKVRPGQYNENMHYLAVATINSELQLKWFLDDKTISLFFH